MNVSEKHDRQPLPAPTIPDEHAWTTESSHVTSSGRVRYVRCIHCGTRRIDFQEHPELPPTALSAEVPATGAPKSRRTSS